MPPKPKSRRQNPRVRVTTEGLGFRVLGFGFRVLGLGFWVLGFRGLGFRVQHAFRDLKRRVKTGELAGERASSRWH